MNEVFGIIKRIPRDGIPLDLENLRQFISTNDINIQDSEGRTILALCCDNYYNCNNIEVIKLLLKSGIDVNIRNNYGVTALLYCCVYRSIEVVNLLIQYKVNVNYQDNKGLTALMITSINSNDNDIKIAKLLLMSRVRNGADVNLQDIKGDTAIMKIVKSIDTICSLKMLRLLLEYNANPYDTQDINIFASNIAKLNALS